MKALVVDDSALARNIIASTLEEVGITEVDLAKDGTESIELVQSNRYDIIFMDWNMPVMQGIEAVKEIRHQGITTPIIMVTGLGDEFHVKEAIGAGVNNYLIKPFKAETAIEKIKETLKTVEV
jgi:CheY-like chemotaxis protein